MRDLPLSKRPEMPILAANRPESEECRLRSKVNKVGEVRMFRKLGPALLVVIGLFSGSTASASPLTFYTDEAAWLAAVSGFAVGTYPYNVTYSDTLVNVALIPNTPGGTCCVISTPPPIFPFAPPVIGEHFTSVDITFSSQELDVNCFYPTFCTFATDVTVNFPTPIYGFASSSAFGRMESGGFYINGQVPPDKIGPFFGVVGLIKRLIPLRPGTLFVVAWRPRPV